MSPVTVFFRTLLKSSAIFVGAAAIFLHPSLDWRSGATAERTSVGAQQRLSESAVNGLIGALSDTDAGVRKQAAHALGSLGAADAVPALTAAIADKDRDVRTAAIDALGAIGDPRALDALTPALKDEDAVIRRHAAAAIADVGGARGAHATPHPTPHPAPHPHPHPHPMPVHMGGAEVQ
jgi:HEAT repeat protein